MKLLIFLCFFLCLSLNAQSYVLKWEKQKVQITLPNTPETIQEDTIDETAYFEYVDVHYDFAFEMIDKKDEDFKYVKNIYDFAIKEMEKDDEFDPKDFILGKLDGLNSFYAIVEEVSTDPKTGAEYKYLVGELVFYSKNKKKLFYFDIEFDEVPPNFVETIIKSIKFY